METLQNAALGHGKVQSCSDVALLRRWNGSDLEYDQDLPRQKLCDWLDAVGGVCSLFDFPTKGILQEAVKNVQYWRLRDKDGRPPGLIGWWPSKAVTFVDNHDTGAPQNSVVCC